MAGLRLLIYWILLNLIAVSAFAQSGNYFLSQHQPPSKAIDNTNFQIIEDQDGILLLANRNGIVKYDAVSWDLIKTPGSIFTLILDNTGTVYAGGSNGFGFLDNTEVYVSLSDSILAPTDIFKIAKTEETIYFLNQKNIFKYEKQTGNIEAIPFDDPSTLSDLFIYGEDIFISSHDGRLFTIDKSEFRQLQKQLPDSSSVLFSRVVDDGNILLGTLADNLFLFNGEVFSKIELAEEELLKSNEVVDAIISDDLISVATLGGGVYFFSLSDGTLLKTVDYLAGLPDNEVFSIGKERTGGIWAAHSYGLTLINPQLPFKNMASFPGLEGNLSAIISGEEQLYVGTTTGLFLLDKEIKYREIEYYVTINNNLKGEVVETPIKKKKGILGFLKKRNTDNRQPKTSRRSTSVKRTRKELESVRYVFKKVEGVNAKVISIQNLRGKIIAATVNGTYEILGISASRIDPEPVRFMFSSNRHRMLFISTLVDELIIYKPTGEVWREEFLPGMVDDLIQSIYEDDQGDLWMASTDAVYQVTLTNGKVTNTNFYDYDNPFFDQVFITKYEGEIILVNTTGYFKVNEDKLQFETDNDILEKLGKPEDIIPSTSKEIWVYQNLEWRGISDSVFSDISLNTLSLFKTPTLIELDQSESKILVATLDNKLYEFPRNADIEIFSSYSLFLKSVFNQSGKLTSSSDLEIQQLDSKLKFEFVKPDYNKILGIQYHYKLSGLSEEWSGWSSNNIVEFPYLPAGRYELSVQSKDIFGQVASLAPIQFEIIAPYWERPWFYALEVFFFGTLFILSFRLNRQDQKYRILSRMLAFFTLILTVEFIQTVAEYNIAMEGSPVISFFIQVGIAFVILPMEALLRKIFFKVKEPSIAEKVAQKS